MPNYEKEITPGVAEILKQGTQDGNIFYLPNVQLDRKMYIEVNTALENLGGKWSRKDKGHVFDSATSAIDLITKALIAGKTVDEKKKDSFFATPVEIIDEMIELANLDNHSGAILEPSAGDGAIVKRIRGKGLSNFIFAIEQNEKRGLEIEGADTYFEDFLRVSQKDDRFKKFPITRILMNPPFSVEGSPQADIDHVLHAWKFLAEGGRLVAIMSQGWMFRANKKSVEFKKFVDEKGFYKENDTGAFRESGTLVKTVTVILDK